MDENDKGDGQLLVTSGDSTAAFDSGEVVFDRASMRIERAVETRGNAPSAFGRDANTASFVTRGNLRFSARSGEFF
jgi:hypothetical protein